MRIPETPTSVENLDLMKRLEAYAEGSATWRVEGTSLGENAQKACRTLHTSTVEVVDKIFGFIADRATARELDTFTMHDRKHGLKVAHLMWHIISEERRTLLTPAEIGILVIAAYLHDAGMSLSRAEREARMAPESDLWERVDVDPATRLAFEQLHAQIGDPSCNETQKRRAERELIQGEEVLLALDTRERHATQERYEQLICELAAFHEKDRIRIPDIHACIGFDGDSFEKKLIDIRALPSSQPACEVTLIPSILPP